MHRPLRLVCAVGLGFGGLVVGHALGYALAMPDPHHRTVALAATGHGYLPSASWLAVVVGIAAVVAGVAAGYVHRSRCRTHRFGRTVAALAVLQCSAFLCLEIFERVVSGAALNSFSPKLVVVGLLVQIVVAFAVALLVAGLRRFGEQLSALPVAVVQGPSDPVIVLLGSSPSHIPTCDRVRGPPPALAA